MSLADPEPEPYTYSLWEAVLQMARLADPNNVAPSQVFLHEILVPSTIIRSTLPLSSGAAASDVEADSAEARARQAIPPVCRCGKSKVLLRQKSSVKKTATKDSVTFGWICPGQEKCPSSYERISR